MVNTKTPRLKGAKRIKNFRLKIRKSAPNNVFNLESLIFNPLCLRVFATWCLIISKLI